MNGCLGSLPTEQPHLDQPLTGFSESQEQKVDNQISSNSGPNLSDSSENIRILSPHWSQNVYRKQLR